MEIKSKKIELIEIEKIISNPKNANVHSNEQIDRLVKLIEFQGFRNPLVVSNRSGFLIAGHGRLEAAKKMGLKKLPVIYQDFNSEAQEYAYLISDNEIARWAKLDEEELKIELIRLDESGDDFGDIELLGLDGLDLFAMSDLDMNDEEKDKDWKVVIAVADEDEAKLIKEKVFSLGLIGEIK